MTAGISENQYLHRFVNNLEEGSTIITDNASYHSVTMRKVPDTSAKAKDINLSEHNKFIV
jgi:predicted O-methyltransferase YrrM